MAASSTGARRKEPGPDFRRLPPEIQQLIECSRCHLLAYDLKDVVVLQCAHLICMKCLDKQQRHAASTSTTARTGTDTWVHRASRKIRKAWTGPTAQGTESVRAAKAFQAAAAESQPTVECPRCAVSSNIPLGGLGGFPRDSFSRVLYNSIMRPESDILQQPIPRCGLHPGESLSDFCIECSVQVCKMCKHHHHQVGTTCSSLFLRLLRTPVYDPHLQFCTKTTL